MNNELFEDFFKNSPAILNLVDETFHYIKTDSLTPTYFGLTRETIIGKTAGDFESSFFKKYGPMLKQVITSGEAKLNVELTSSVPSRNGGLGYWQASYFPVSFPNDKKGLGIIGIDITERKEVEERLKRSENRLKRAEQIGRIGNWEYDITRDNVIWSDGVYLLFDRDPEAGPPTEKEESRYYTDEDKNRLKGYAKQVIETGEPILDYEFRINLRDSKKSILLGSMYPFKDESGQVTKLYGTYQDITKQKQAEEELRESQKKLKVIFDMLPVGISVIDRENEIVFMNPALEKILGLSKEGLLRGDHRNRTYLRGDGTQMPKEEFATARSLIEGKSIYNVEIGVVKEDGSKIWTNVSTIVVDNIPDWQNITITSDITKRKLAEEKIKGLLSEKELLLKEVHHRIKNNMNTMMSLLSFQSDTLKDPFAITALDEARNRFQSMSVLYEKLFRTNNLKEMSVQDYLPSLVDEIVNMFPGSSSVKVEKKVDAIVLGVNVLATLGILINELITNIMKYAFKEKTDGLIRVAASKIKDRVTIVVGDNGIGMPDSINLENSTGFGLTLVNAMTQQLNGTIRIERKNGTPVHFGVRGAVIKKTTCPQSLEYCDFFSRGKESFYHAINC